jgi:hypothetical protein
VEIDAFHSLTPRKQLSLYFVDRISCVHFHLAHYNSLTQLQGLVLDLPLWGGVGHLDAVHGVQHDRYILQKKKPRTFTSNRMLTERYAERETAVRGEEEMRVAFWAPETTFGNRKFVVSRGRGEARKERAIWQSQVELVDAQENRAWIGVNQSWCAAGVQFDLEIDIVVFGSGAVLSICGAA